MLYVPWRDESSDLLGGYMDFHSHYEDKADDILENELSILRKSLRLMKPLMISPSMDHLSMQWDQVVLNNKHKLKQRVLKK